MSAFRGDKGQNSRFREKQLEALKKMEDRLKNIIKPALKKTVKPKMAMFVLDISKALSPENKVVWLPMKSVATGSPESTILYTLVKGNGELIMFGGIRRDAGTITSDNTGHDMAVSNSLHFISAPLEII